MPNPKSKVFFADLRAGSRRNLFDKIGELLSLAGIAERFRKGHLVAIKLHFGEKGNSSYIRPVFVRRAVDAVKETGALPFLTDTNTLYVGTRGDTVNHLTTAIGNGFAYPVVDAPLVIADGLRGELFTEVRVGGKFFESVKIASMIASSNGLLALTHFKCHEMTGFGGALKNIGMGCASREGKLSQHSNLAPLVDPAGCTACGECSFACPVNAIDIGNVAVINPASCIGCGHCIAACPEGTINIQWTETASNLQGKMAEYAKGALFGKEDRSLFVNFITDVSPACDCYGHNDAPIVPDIGILASSDPVAIDQASADLVNAEEGIKDSALKSGRERGGDKFRGVHPNVDWEVQLDAAEALGIGRRLYDLEKI